MIPRIPPLAGSLPGLENWAFSIAHVSSKRCGSKRIRHYSGRVKSQGFKD
jgi:hypothetical protein